MIDNPDTLSYFIKREQIARYNRLLADITRELNSGRISPSDLGGKLEALLEVVKAKTPVEIEGVKLPVAAEGDALPVKSSVRKRKTR